MLMLKIVLKTNNCFEKLLVVTVYLLRRLNIVEQRLLSGVEWRNVGAVSSLFPS